MGISSFSNSNFFYVFAKKYSYRSFDAKSNYRAMGYGTYKSWGIFAILSNLFFCNFNIFK